MFEKVLHERDFVRRVSLKFTRHLHDRGSVSVFSSELRAGSEDWMNPQSIPQSVTDSARVKCADVIDKGVFPPLYADHIEDREVFISVRVLGTLYILESIPRPSDVSFVTVVDKFVHSMCSVLNSYDLHSHSPENDTKLLAVELECKHGYSREVAERLVEEIFGTISYDDPLKMLPASSVNARMALIANAEETVRHIHEFTRPYPKAKSELIRHIAAQTGVHLEEIHLSGVISKEDILGLPEILGEKV